jgi:hypothetical protein
LDIDLKTVLPAIGVIIGWFLSELSQLFKSRREARRLINKSLYSLLNLLLMLNHKQNLVKSALQPAKLNEFQAEMLANLFEDRVFDSDDFKKKLFQNVNDLAEIDPILCQAFMMNIESVNLLGKIRTSERHKIPNRNDLESMHQMLEVFANQLERLTRKLIAKHSFIMRIRYELYKRKNLGDDKVPWEPIFKNQT